MHVIQDDRFDKLLEFNQNLQRFFDKTVFLCFSARMKCPDIEGNIVGIHRTPTYDGKTS